MNKLLEPHNYIKNFKHKIKNIIASETKPSKVAGGCALGVFVALLPIIGFQTVVIIVLSFIFKVNKIAALSFSMIINPVTIVFIFGFNYKIGCKILTIQDSNINIAELISNLKIRNFEQIAESGINMLIPLVTGSLIVATVCAVFTYSFINILLANSSLSKFLTQTENTK